MMKKICYVVTIPLSFRAFFMPQLKYLADNGFDVSVICCPDDTLQDELGERIRFIPAEIPRGISVFGSLKAIVQLKKIFKREKFDLVQYSTANAAFYSSIASRKVGIKLRNYHLMGIRYLGFSGIIRKIFKTIEKISCNNSTSIECVSNSNLETGIQEGLFDASKGTVVWNGSTGGVDLNKFDFSKRKLWRNEVRNKYGFNDDDFVIGFVGRITKDKGIDELLNAFFEMKNKAKLMFIGDKEGIETLNKDLWSRAQSDENITFVDFTDEIEKYFPALDVIALPSYREGFGNVIIEAAAMGTPAIISNIPGPIDAVELGTTGIVVNKGDWEDLKEKLDDVIENNSLSSPEYCHEFIKSHFDSEELCKKIAERKKMLLGE